MRNLPQSPMVRFNIFSILSGIHYGLFLPAWIIEMQSRGVSLLQLGLFGTLLEISKLVIEVPTGVFADRYGQKKSIQLGSSLWILAWLVFYLSQSHIAFGLVHILIAFAECFISGAYEGLLSRTCRHSNQSFKQVYSRLTAVSLGSLTLAGILGGYSYSYAPHNHFILVLGVALVLTLSSSLLPSVKNWEELSLSRKPMSHILAEGLRAIRQSKVLIRILIASLFFNFLLDGVNRYWQPLFHSKNINPVWFGWVVGLSTFVSALVLYAHSFRKRDWNLRGLAIIDVLAMAGSILLTRLTGRPLIALSTAVMSLEPIRNLMYSASLDAEIKENQTVASTVFSVGSWAGALGEAASGLILGILAELYGIETALVIGSLICFLSFLAEIPAFRKRGR